MKKMNILTTLLSSSEFYFRSFIYLPIFDDFVVSIWVPNQSDSPKEHFFRYVPNVGDSKRAMDEYTSEIFLGGVNTIAMHNTCEDSLLATPLIIDLVILAEMSTRIEYKTTDMKEYSFFHPVMSILSYFIKAPLVPPGAPVVNALFKQHGKQLNPNFNAQKIFAQKPTWRFCFSTIFSGALQNIFRACLGLQPENFMLLEHKRGMGERLNR